MIPALQPAHFFLTRILLLTIQRMVIIWTHMQLHTYNLMVAFHMGKVISTIRLNRCMIFIVVYLHHIFSFYLQPWYHELMRLIFNLTTENQKLTKIMNSWDLQDLIQPIHWFFFTVQHQKSLSYQIFNSQTQQTMP